jgi:heat-inducible transcriptional repressor
MLDRRKGAILRAIVRDYVRSGQPVGSQTLGRRYRLKISPATIRNEMAQLEEQGFLTHPHTSAGRIPTDRGYRWFVDNWPGRTWPALPDRQRIRIEHLTSFDFRGLEEALEGTSRVLSEVTEATAVVVAPPVRKNLLRRLELIPRDDGRVTLLLIADTGVVEQGLVDLPETTSEQLYALAADLSIELEGVAFEDLSGKVRGAGKVPARSRIAAEVERITGTTPERVFREGTANILTPEKFPDIAVAHEVVEALESPSTIAGLADAARRTEHVTVFIGGEVPVRQMRSCAVVISSYEAGTGRVGTLGVVGPTRIDYPHTISAVQAVSRSLSEILDLTV